MEISRLNKVGNATARKKIQVSSRDCVLRSAFFANLSGSTIYIQFHDATTEPQAGAVPAFPDIPLLANQSAESSTPRSFLDGCWMMASSTRGSLTLIGANEAQLAAEPH